MKPKHAIWGGIVLLALLSLPLVLNRGGQYEPHVTADTYAQITLTLTYDQVVDVVGRDGIPMDMTIDQAMGLKDVQGRLIGAMANENFQVYGWANKRKASGDDPRILVMFVNGRAVAKKQYGLY